MFSPTLARPLGYLLSIGFLIGAALGGHPRGGRGTRGSAPTMAGRRWRPPHCRSARRAARMRPPTRTVTVANRKELIAALAWPDATPKLIYVQGTIDVNVDNSQAPHLQ